MQTFLQNPNFITPSASASPLHVKSFIVCARRRSIKPPFFTQKTTRLMLNTALTVASTLNILPQPLTALVREFGSGNGGGFRKGFGGGGGGGGFWRRRGRRSVGILGLLVVCGLGLRVSGKLSQNDAVLCGLGLVLVAGLMSFCKGGIVDWGLGFCSCVGIVSFLRLGRKDEEEVGKWGKKIRAFVPVLKGVGRMGRSKSGRRTF